jgi:hypothetical protein
MGERLKILLAGMVAGDPEQGGATWAVLQYFLGLRDLGHDVVLVEPVAAGQGRSQAASATVSYFESLAMLEGKAALLWTDSGETTGLSLGELREFSRGADLLINISGMLADERLMEPIPVRAFLDLDPGFNQVWHLTGEDMGLDRHTHFVTVGQAVGDPGCAVPTCERRWIKTLPPVVLDRWPVVSGNPAGDITTVGHWRSYGSIEYGGIRYGQRAHSLRDLIEIPKRVEERFTLALGIHPGEVRDLEALSDNGWNLVDPAAAAGTPGRYASFIRGSKAEFGVAKSGYVVSRSGWFSDRSACYLASGRPVVAQETGFRRALPLGEGLLVFSTLDEAIAAVEEVRLRPARHSTRARELAEEAFDSRKVLTRLLHELGATAARELAT